MTEATQKEFVIIREFNAPRELVFKVLTEAEHLAHWWGPKGSVIKVSKVELHPGGLFHYSMQMGDAPEMWGRFVYREIIAPEKIVFINSFSDAEGGIAANPFMPEWPLEVLNTLTLTESEGKTTIHMKGWPINATEKQEALFVNMQGSMQQGFKGTYDQLEEYLQTLS